MRARHRTLTSSPALAALLVAVLAAPSAAQVEGDARIGADADPTLASVGVSQATYADQTAFAAVVGRSDIFADNLAGSALAGSIGGPLLLTDGGPGESLREEVVDEIGRAFNPAQLGCEVGGSDVIVLGGDQAVSAAAFDRLVDEGYCVQRLFGFTRVETSVAVASVIEGFPEPAGMPRRILIARDNDPADSAAGGAYGGRFFVPIVVTQGDSLNPSVRDYLFARDETFFEDVVLLGGTVALSQDVEDQLRENAPNPEAVRRVMGPTRDGTAAAIGRLYRETSAAAGGEAGGAMLVNGFSGIGWVYALTGGAASYRFQTPVLYVQPDSVPPDTEAYLSEFGAPQLLTVGPDTEVSEDTRATARAIADG